VCLTIELISSMNALHSGKSAEGPERISESNSKWVFGSETFPIVSNFRAEIIRNLLPKPHSKGRGEYEVQKVLVVSEGQGL
jgi:hypothetical protein